MAHPRYYSFVLRYLSLLAFKRKTLGRTVEQLAASRGSAPGCSFEGETLSYAELNRRANRRAHVFRDLGVGKGDVVCLLMENRPEYLETVIAMAKLGAVTALINHNLKGPSLAHCIDISGATRVLVGAECLEALQVVLPDLARVKADTVYVDTRWAEYGPPTPGMHDLNTLLATAAEDNPRHPPLNSKDPVLYIYTSGTTGLPKAASISHFRWYAAGLAMGYYALHVEAQDVVYCPLPLYHSNGILIAFGAAMVTGATFAVTRRFSASGFWREAKDCGATCFIYIGEVLRYLVNHPPGPDEQAHRIARILGNGLRPDIWPTVRERFRIPVIREFYASTEGNAITINMNNAEGSVGTAVLKLSDNTTLVHYDVENDAYLRDANGFCERAAPGEVGEMLGQIKVTMPFHGYTSREDTEKKILRDVFKQGDAYFRTGDLMKKDAAGNYYFVDRIGDTFRWKGENVATQEVQELLAGFDGVHMVSVYGVEIPGTEGRAGMAALLMEEGRTLDPAALYRYAVEHLAVYAVPAFVRLVREMDVTGTFKLRKTDLQAQAYDPARVDDTMYYLDRERGTYTVLDADAYRRMQAGEVRF